LSTIASYKQIIQSKRKQKKGCPQNLFLLEPEQFWLRLKFVVRKLSFNPKELSQRSLLVGIFFINFTTSGFKYFPFSLYHSMLFVSMKVVQNLSEGDQEKNCHPNKPVITALSLQKKNSKKETLQDEGRAVQ